VQQSRSRTSRKVLWPDCSTLQSTQRLKNGFSSRRPCSCSSSSQEIANPERSTFTIATRGYGIGSTLTTRSSVDTQSAISTAWSANAGSWTSWSVRIYLREKIDGSWTWVRDHSEVASLQQQR